jgi:uncharacterized protein
VKHRIKPLTYLILSTFIVTLFGCYTGSKECSKIEEKTINIGTGNIIGVYYPAGRAIAEILNTTPSPTLKFNARAKTAYNASEFNVIDVLNGDLTCGISQTDDLSLMYNKKVNNSKKLRAILTLHTEALTLLATDKSGINSYKDLKGKTVRTGASAILSNSIKEALAIEKIQLSDINHVISKSILCPDMMQKGKLDAYFFTVGHPNDNTASTLSGKNKSKMISLPSSSIDKIFKKYPYYIKTSIPLSLYGDSKDKIDTIGMKAVLFTTADTSEEVVYDITKAIFKKLYKLKQSTPALKNIKKEDMVKGMVIPIHKGAMKYFKEAKLK